MKALESAFDSNTVSQHHGEEEKGFSSDGPLDVEERRLKKKKVR